MHAALCCHFNVYDEWRLNHSPRTKCYLYNMIVNMTRYGSIDILIHSLEDYPTPIISPLKCYATRGVG